MSDPSFDSAGDVGRLAMACIAASAQDDNDALFDIIDHLDARSLKWVLVGVLGTVGGLFMGLPPDISDELLSKLGLATAELP